MLLSNEFVGKTVKIEMVEFATASPKVYKGKVEKVISYGENIIMLKLDTDVTLNAKYILSITIVD